MIKDFATLSSIDEIFIKYTSYSYFEFELEWYDDLKKRYRWMAWLQFENLLWFILIIFIFFAFILRKIRNRRIIKEWEKEDFYE